MGGFEPADDVFDKRKRDEQGAAHYERAKRKSLSGKGCVVVVVFFAVFFTGVFACIFALISPMFAEVGDVANAFMVAMRDKDHDAAYELGTSEFQQQVEHPENLTILLDDPRDWRFNSFSVKNGYGTVRGNVQFDDGSSSYITFTLQQEQGSWKIFSVNLNF
jgi:hypothetical protein